VPTDERETRVDYGEDGAARLTVRRAKLVAITPPVREWLFEGRSVSIGAAARNDVVIDDDLVSRTHCQIVLEGEGYVLRDADSKNGTFLDGVRIREAFLAPGQTIRVGRVELSFLAAYERSAIVPSDKSSLGLLVGEDRRMREVYAIIERIAPTPAAVLVEGETGSGKEAVARTIHECSDRRHKPFVVFDCSAVQPALIESELFGHERGSFTGATITRRGIMEVADDGTLFLDEIGELPLELQPKLLRAIDRLEIRRVGASINTKVDVRIIAATNRVLADEVRERRFRDDLYYRLSVIRLHVPPLRERRQDIPLLVRQFLATVSATISSEALALLRAQSWPGNVRQLKNAVDHACALCGGGVIDLEHLPADLIDAPCGEERDFKSSKDAWVRSFVENLVAKHGGNISGAAREAKIERNYLKKLLRKHGVR
jgi:DNA-binding NtrC family response regulator